MQFKAGYIIDSVGKIIDNYRNSLDRNLQNDIKELNKIDGLLQHVCSFNVEFPFNFNPDYKNINPVLATINNIITRGLPTKAPIIVEEAFVKIKLIKKNIKEYEYVYNELDEKSKIDYDTIFELLHLIWPELKINRKNYGGAPEGGEWEFLNKKLKKYPFAKQILQSQREFSTINHNLIERRVDFSFEFPYLNISEGFKELKKKGVIIEVDGSHHNTKTYKYYDKYRDAAAETEGFTTLRQRVNAIGDNIEIENLFNHRTFKIFEKNYKRDINEYLSAFTLLFTPLAVARIQKTLIEYFIVHPELFKKENIKIAVIERDLPAGALAIKGLEGLFENINEILTEKNKLILPKIELSVFDSKKWLYHNKLHLDIEPKNEDDFYKDEFDIIIDHSILLRSNVYNFSTYKNENAIVVRSSHFSDNSFGNARRVYCANLLEYKLLAEKQDDGSYKGIPELKENISYFLQNIFRKKDFREGQLAIISRALQQKPVIGLLPTGGGKSLTYQLSALLQPGLCLIVDPIKSLMEDQVRVMKNHYIDTCSFINSNLDRKIKVKKLIDFRYGETQFLFVSPERFVMDDFRKIIKNLDSDIFGLAFSFCVIDEVHCVSEWGHDFRTTYLMLGKNAQEFSKTKNRKPVTLLGLTATASFDVLADIERELQIKGNDVADAIIMIENTIRPELFFRVIDVTGKDRIEELNNDFKNTGKNLQKLNNEKIIKKSIEHHINNFVPLKKEENIVNGVSHNKTNFAENDLIPQNLLLRDDKGKLLNLNNLYCNDFYSIIFCPVKGMKRNQAGEFANRSGVNYVYSNLDIFNNIKGVYYSCDTDIEHEICENRIKESFEGFMNGKIKHMICTKAFGMGIDKADIRTTYHYYYSSSLEGFVQEAGRSGRDKKIALANVLVSKKKHYKIDVYKFFKENITNIHFKNKFTRKAIREAFERRWNDANGNFEIIEFESLDKALKEIDNVDFTLMRRDGTRYKILPQQVILDIRNKLKEKGNNQYKYITEKFDDRNIHDYFHQNSFRGIDVEKSQFWNLFYVKEFELLNDEMVYIANQDTLANTFNNCQSETFDFIITATKEYKNISKRICEILNVNPESNAPFSNKKNKEIVQKALKYSNDFDDFLFILEEKNVINQLDNVSERDKLNLLHIYSRDRKTSNDTGRLIYRMHSMGFLKDYTIDYNKNNLYHCTFRKYIDIYDYVSKIEKYLRRYLSENTALENISRLKQRLTKPKLIDNIIECLYFLSEFSYKEIANKRKRATDEIENLLNKSISEELYSNNWFEQNKFIKEQIYFYFNAKYARIDFKINGKPYSLLEDYKNVKGNKIDIIIKYLGVFNLEGTAQNNYKHMIGSCKKIMMSLSETDLKKEWLLRLLKAFAMYSVNNESYISEANEELEKGFENLYLDQEFHNNNFEIIERFFEIYFNKLLENIQKNNKLLKDIKLIRIVVLSKLQLLRLNGLLELNKMIKT